jgi:hypothetical protein
MTITYGYDEIAQHGAKAGFLLAKMTKSGILAIPMHVTA